MSVESDEYAKGGGRIYVWEAHSVGRATVTYGYQHLRRTDPFTHLVLWVVAWTPTPETLLRQELEELFGTMERDYAVDVHEFNSSWVSGQAVWEVGLVNTFRQRLEKRITGGWRVSVKDTSWV